jgi:hypothetical protein
METQQNNQMTNLMETLLEQTQELKKSYIKKTIEWSKEEYKRLKDFVNDYNTNYDSSKSKKYYSLPYCVVNPNGNIEDYTSMQTEKAEKHYFNSIQKLASRILKKGLNESKLKMKTSYLDPNINTVITDGEKTISAFTIIASGNIQRPHYRYLIK